MLRGETIYLRTIEPADASILLEWENNPENWRVSNTLVPFSKKLIEDYVNSAQDIYTVKQLRFIICLIESDKPIGTLDLFDFDPYHQRAGIGILIADKKSRRSGLAQESLELVIEYSFNLLNLHQLYCNILVDNKASIELFQKVGFTICGTKKDWVKSKNGRSDEHTLQLLSLS